MSFPPSLPPEDSKIIMTQVDQPEKKPVPDHASDLGPGIIREGGNRGISPSLVGRASADPRKTLVMSKGMMGTVVRAILGCLNREEKP